MKEKANKIIAAAMAVCVVVLCIAAAVTVSRSKDKISGFQGVPWGTRLTDVIQTGGDFALVRSEEDVTVLYRLDGEGRLAAGEYVPADGQPPAEPGEEDGFDGFPYGTPAEEIAAEADWRYWHLAQEGVPVGGLEATAVYRFDGDGKLRAGWYDFPGTDQASVDAAWQAGLTWLEETYGLASGEDGDPTSLWTVGKVQVSLARTPDGVRLTVAGDGYPV